MMGLLDSLGSDEGLLGLYLMSAGAAKPQRTSLGEGLLGGMQLMRQLKDQREAKAIAEQERQQKALMQAAQMKMIDAQVGETQAQAQQRQAEAQKVAQALARQQAFQNALGSPTSAQQALANGGGPTPQNAAMIGQSRAPNWQDLALKFPDQVELIKKLAESQNFGAPEVARTIEGRDAQGRPVTLQFDKQGRQIGDGVQQWKAPEKVDTGGAVQFFDPVTLAALSQVAKTQSPDSKASNAVAWANNAISRDRLAFDKGQADKPVWDAERGIVVNPRSATGQEVMVGGKPVGAKDKGLNDTQAKALLFGTRMKEADKIIGEMAGQGVTMPSLIKAGVEGVPLIGGALGTIANSTVASDKQQQVEQAQRDFINATLRRESGAAIAAEEFANARRQYFPQPGDSPAVIAQKARNRALATQGIMAEVPENKRVLPTMDPTTPKIVNFGDLK